ncbi:MAG: MinD/ParA family protein [Desulfarculales bacterium]|jgi:flagellar biosynthesis protein FlhG|nr:MinD/ParA family protein [Desulfarculales bacterium]
MSKEFPNDQAQTLRRLAAQKRARGSPAAVAAPQARPVRTLCVTSGKGGVGKTNMVVNLALALTRLGRKVLIIDADLGLANVDVVLGLNPAYTIQDVLNGSKQIAEVLVRGPAGIWVLPAASGVAQLSNLAANEKMALLQALDGLPDDIDIDMVIVDTAAGISDTVLYFNMAAQERLVVATGEPTSLTDAYALMKVLFAQHQERKFYLVVNNVESPLVAKDVYRKLSTAVDHFLTGLSLDYLGYIPADPLVSKAVIRQTPFLEAFPSSEASKAVGILAKTLLTRPVEDPSRGNIKFFWRRLVEMK